MGRRLSPCRCHVRLGQCRDTRLQQHAKPCDGIYAFALGCINHNVHPAHLSSTVLLCVFMDVLVMQSLYALIGYIHAKPLEVHHIGSGLAMGGF